MIISRYIYYIYLVLVLNLLFVQPLSAQERIVVDSLNRVQAGVTDDVALGTDVSTSGATVDSAMIDSFINKAKFASVNVGQNVMAENMDSKRWIPDPKKAMWLAIAFPGGGQIYNRKYWKLPIFYGGFLGCFYALNWNNTMYRDYSQAYVDIMDSDENTNSYLNFIPPTYNVEANIERLQNRFRQKKNFYRRYRDMSMFCMIGVYLLSIVDAYVDAEMSSFDISRDLSVKFSPAVINDRYSAMHIRSMNGSSYGINCSLNF